MAAIPKPGRRKYPAETTQVPSGFMSRAIHRLFSILLAGLFALALSGPAPSVAAAVDCMACAALDSGCDAPPTLDADPDDDTHPDIAASPADLSAHSITAAGAPLPRRAAGTHLGHWPHAPPL